MNQFKLRDKQEKARLRGGQNIVVDFRQPWYNCRKGSNVNVVEGNDVERVQIYEGRVIAENVIWF